VELLHGRVRGAALENENGSRRVPNTP
jgi:hypothetical protein